jgi:hypothetical protein
MSNISRHNSTCPFWGGITAPLGGGGQTSVISAAEEARRQKSPDQSGTITPASRYWLFFEKEQHYQPPTAGMQKAVYLNSIATMFFNPINALSSTWNTLNRAGHVLHDNQAMIRWASSKIRELGSTSSLLGREGFDGEGWQQRRELLPGAAGEPGRKVVQGGEDGQGEMGK